VDFQIALVTDFTKEEADLLVKSTVQGIETIRTSLSDLLQAWRTGDTAKLEKLLNESMDEAPMIEKRMLTDRNRKWVPKIRELLQGNKTAVVIVGAGHLVGHESVVELLRKEGPKYQYGSGCLSDGVLGDWIARCAGVDSTLSPAKVKKHLVSIFRHNFNNGRRMD
jgi:uncharacterized protein YbaP (TraB family)